MSRIFISYSRQDEDFVHQLAESLSNLGVDFWIDKQGIQIGTRWSDAVQDALDDCEKMLVIISPDSMASQNVKDEWQYFMDEGKQVIPVRWKPAKMHFQLRRLQYIDFHNQDYTDTFEKLCSVLGVKSPTKPAQSTVKVQIHQPSEGIPIPENVKAVIADLNRRVLDILPPPFEWCYIPAGAFLMGSDRSKDKQAYDQEPDIHEVTLPAFLMAKYPVTYAQFQVFIDAGDGIQDERWWEGLAEQNREAFNQEWKIADHPRENVNWYEATAFCRWLDNRLRRGGANPPQEYDPMNAATWLIRLPTEAEWEKGARGTAGRIYPWGDVFDKYKCNTRESDIKKTTPVGQYPAGASPYGVLDMSGNVWEWCLSEWRNPYGHQGLEEISISSDNRRVLRGGSFVNPQSLARSASRSSPPPPPRPYLPLGFRVCCAAPSL